MYIKDIFGSDVWVYNPGQHNNMDLQLPVAVTFASVQEGVYDMNTPDVIHLMYLRCYNLVLKRYRGTRYHIRHLDWIRLDKKSEPAVPNREILDAFQKSIDSLSVQVSGIDPDVTFVSEQEHTGSIGKTDWTPDVRTSVHFFHDLPDQKMETVLKQVSRSRSYSLTQSAASFVLEQDRKSTPPKYLVQVVSDGRMDYFGARKTAMEVLVKKSWTLPVMLKMVHEGKSYFVQEAHPHVRPLSELIRPRVWRSLSDDVANNCCRSLLDLVKFFSESKQLEYVPCGLDHFMHDLLVDVQTGRVYIWNMSHIIFTTGGRRYAFGFSNAAAPEMGRRGTISALERNVRQSMTELLHHSRN